MNVLVPALFAFAGFAAIWAMSSSLKSALPAIRLLRRRQREAMMGVPVTVRKLPTRAVPDDVGPRRSETACRRGARPKPVTHRLHRFPHRIDAA